MIFLSGDHHFFHKNILQYCNRKFDHVDAMNEALIKAWNKTVGINDVVYHLGDFALCNEQDARNVFAQLNGSIYMLTYPWHHDRFWLPKQLNGIDRVLFVGALEILVEKDLPQITLCHYPLEEWDKKHYGSWHCHGHSHGVKDATRQEKILDVGVDNAYRLFGEYRPFALSDVEKIMERRGLQ